MILHYTHKSMPSAAIIRWASSYSIWEQIQGSERTNTETHCHSVQWMSDLRTLRLKWDIYINPPPPPTVCNEPCWIGYRKIVRAIGDVRQQGNRPSKSVCAQSTFEPREWAIMHRACMGLPQGLCSYIMDYSLVSLWNCQVCDQVCFVSYAFSWIPFHLFVLSNFNVLVYSIVQCSTAQYSTA